jgi:hypothetical protein
VVVGLGVAVILRRKLGWQSLQDRLGVNGHADRTVCQFTVREVGGEVLTANPDTVLVEFATVDFDFVRHVRFHDQTLANRLAKCKGYFDLFLIKTHERVLPVPVKLETSQPSFRRTILFPLFLPWVPLDILQ